MFFFFPSPSELPPSAPLPPLFFSSVIEKLAVFTARLRPFSHKCGYAHSHHRCLLKRRAVAKERRRGRKRERERERNKATEWQRSGERGGADSGREVEKNNKKGVQVNSLNKDQERKDGSQLERWVALQHLLGFVRYAGAYTCQRCANGWNVCRGETRSFRSPRVNIWGRVENSDANANYRCRPPLQKMPIACKCFFLRAELCFPCVLRLRPAMTTWPAINQQFEARTWAPSKNFAQIATKITPVNLKFW